MRRHIVKLLEHPGVIRYSKNISWMFFARIFTMGVSFLTTLYIARTLGPTNFGELDYAMAVIAVLGPLASLGIANVLQRELIKHPEDNEEILGTALSINAMCAAIATLLAVATALLFHRDTLSTLLILILSLTFIFGIFQLLQQEFYARAEAKIPSLITMVVWVIISLGKVYVLLLGKGVLWLAGISVVEQILYALFFLAAYNRYGRGKLSALRYSKTYSPIILKTGAAAALASFFILIYARIDQIFIKHLLDAHAVGLYSSGVRLVDIWNMVPGLLLSGFYPAILNARAVSKELYNKRMKRLLLVIVSSGVVLSLCTSLAAPVLIGKIFGPAFIGGTASLRIYAWSMVGTFLGIYVMNILFTEDAKKALIITNVMPAVVNVILNIIWIPHYGIIGAAYATVIAYSITPLVPLAFKRYRREIFEILATN